MRYLTRQQQYSHIILDVQSDDYKMLSCILGSGYPIDKMVMVMTQDPHAVMTAGTMIMNLSSVRAASLVAGGEFIVNRYNPNAAITSAKIESVLHLGANQISKLGEDSLGFLSASDSAVPYLLNKGKFWMDIDSLRKKIFGNV